SGRTETKTYGKAADTSAFQTFTRLKALWQGMRLPGESLGHHFPEKNSSRKRSTTYKSWKRCCSSQKLSRRGAFSAEFALTHFLSPPRPYRRFWFRCGLEPWKKTAPGGTDVKSFASRLAARRVG